MPQAAALEVEGKRLPRPPICPCCLSVQPLKPPCSGWAALCVQLSRCLGLVLERGCSVAVTQVRPMGEVQGTCPGPVTTCRGWGEFGQDGTWGQWWGHLGGCVEALGLRAYFRSSVPS